MDSPISCIQKGMPSLLQLFVWVDNTLQGHGQALAEPSLSAIGLSENLLKYSIEFHLTIVWTCRCDSIFLHTPMKNMLGAICEPPLLSKYCVK